jgi:membrane protein DedA with SNARE-associated domain
MGSNAPLWELAGALIGGGLGLPIPEELVLVAGGYHLWLRDVEPRALVAVCLAAVLVGDLTLYAIGRFGGRPLARRLVGDARLARLERAFAARRMRWVFGARFVPGLRAAVLVSAGVARLRAARLFAWDGAAAAVGVALWLWIGTRLGPEVSRAASVVGTARAALLAVAVAAALVVWLGRRRAIRS